MTALDLSKKQSEVLASIDKKLLVLGPFGCGKSTALVQYAAQSIAASRKVVIVCNDHLVIHEISNLNGYWQQRLCEVFSTYRFWQHFYKEVCLKGDLPQSFLLPDKVARLSLEKWFLPKDASHTDKRELHRCYELYFFEKLQELDSSLDDHFCQTVKAYQLNLLEVQKIDMCGLLYFMHERQALVVDLLTEIDAEFCFDDYQNFTALEHFALCEIFQDTTIKIFFDSNLGLFDWRSFLNSVDAKVVKKGFKKIKIIKLKKQFVVKHNQLQAAHRAEKLAGLHTVADKSVEKGYGNIELLYFENTQSQVDFLQNAVTIEMEQSVDESPCAILFRTHKQLNEFLQKEPRAEISSILELPANLLVWIKAFMCEDGHKAYHNLWSAGALSWVNPGLDDVFRDVYQAFGSVGDFFHNLAFPIPDSDSVCFYSVWVEADHSIYVNRLQDGSMQKFDHKQFFAWLDKLEKKESICFVSNVVWLHQILQKRFFLFFKTWEEDDCDLIAGLLREASILRQKYAAELKVWLELQGNWKSILDSKNWHSFELHSLSFLESAKMVSFSSILKSWQNSVRSAVNPMLPNRENLKKMIVDRDVYFIDWIVLGTVHACSYRRFKKIWVPHFDEDHYPPMAFRNAEHNNNERRLVGHLMRMATEQITFLTSQAAWHKEPLLAKELSLL